MFKDRMNDLRRRLAEYSGLVEKMIEKSISGLVEKDKDRLTEVINKDEPKANKFEILLDELGTAMIAQFQPKAKDLRTILMILRMNNDLERMADHAVNISEDGLFLVSRPQVKPLIDIPRMAETAMSMVRDSINSFITEDVVLARSVCERDAIVDGLLDQVLRELITHMVSDSKTIERSIRLMAIARNLERIADLSTNICEDVIFMVQGKVIKHHFEG
ncbi:MAG TPA: phosphate signaling complex protein PhoU [Syntrophorhabdaceae bacterium]|jgi:phosphate transport system protein